MRKRCGFSILADAGVAPGRKYYNTIDRHISDPVYDGTGAGCSWHLGNPGFFNRLLVS